MNKSLIIKGLAAAAILCFFLPFFTVSCDYGAGKQDLVTMNGIKLLTGVKNSDLNMKGLEEYTDSSDSGSSDQAFKGNFAAILLVLIPAGILAVSFMKLKNNEIMILIAAAVCFILCFYLRADVVDKAGGDAGAYITVKNQIGFWLTILAHLGIIGFIVYDKFIAKMLKKPAGADVPPAIPTAPTEQS